MMKKKLLNIQGITYLKLQWKINVDMRYFGREKLARFSHIEVLSRI